MMLLDILLGSLRGRCFDASSLLFWKWLAASAVWLQLVPRLPAVFSTVVPVLLVPHFGFLLLLAGAAAPTPAAWRAAALAALHVATFSLLLVADLRAGWAPRSHATLAARLVAAWSGACRPLWAWLAWGHCERLLWAVLEWTRLSRSVRSHIVRAANTLVLLGILIRYRSISLVSLAIVLDLLRV